MNLHKIKENLIYADKKIYLQENGSLVFVANSDTSSIEVKGEELDIEIITEDFVAAILGEKSFSYNKKTNSLEEVGQK